MVMLLEIMRVIYKSLVYIVLYAYSISPSIIHVAAGLREACLHAGLLIFVSNIGSSVYTCLGYL